MSSHTGIWTRVAWVKAKYPNLLDYMGIMGIMGIMIVVGFEPTKHNALELESNPFDRSGILSKSPPAGLEPATYRLTAERSANWAIEDCYMVILHSENNFNSGNINYIICKQIIISFYKRPELFL